MPDPRFFEDLGPIGLSRLAELTGAQLAPGAGHVGDVTGVAVLNRATPGTVTFLSDPRRADELASTKAAACFVHPKQAAAAPVGCAALLTPSPQAAYALAAGALHRPRRNTADRMVSPSARLEDGVRVEPGAVIGDGAQIGARSVIGAGAVIGPGVTIGRDCEIGPRATVTFAVIGDRVRIFAGAMIGEAGFGATVGAGGLIDIPQLGRVIVQDGVTIGAGVCVDRGAFDDTVIGENTKIDNMVQIAHNVRIGRNCAIAAQTGISGSVVVGDGVQFGGRAGVADHLIIGEGARVAAAAGVMRDIPPGETWGGFPARPLKKWMREVAWLSRMAERRGNGAGA
ncbi:UDP-3-O-(3-hydroxymyristoyl)glucosamine N-acyltransferase [Phenylobacterium sp.]|uniref:UDP-3-O-(3-hydroxymyristoyl)glucosamine N-acyltransferase n=1 Tax=Phenylobacterium sp. TaxID=1871053 RepID=UPI00272F604F|nr:UDP-3-O-(3-hydroxymyristoyl)glucosamine N-acyltransferase [Phenylobacterium sp.]MDP1874755.1 UDP-3-O-(3-hydroxymyristoyl)glucosamine N-acyltransferase [Phenylobacterium sp.]MDP3490093.1 UDP-3-O-(3-hydroxymyristoyl)glucosamine N-acyltransferase [Phenylobacterium sp.]